MLLLDRGGVCTRFVFLITHMYSFSFLLFERAWAGLEFSCLIDRCVRVASFH